MKKSVSVIALLFLITSITTITTAQDDNRDRLRDRVADIKAERVERVDAARERIGEARDRIADARADALKRIKEARMKARTTLKERIGDENIIKKIHKGKLVYYGHGVTKEKLERLCNARGGTFNECGSACEEGEDCVAVCVPTCDGITKRPAEVEERLKKEMRIKEAEGKKRKEYRTRIDGKEHVVRVDLQEREDGSTRRLVRFKTTDGEHKVVRTRLTLKDAEGNKDTYIKVVRSDGEEKEVKIVPERARKIALERLAAADGSIELKEKMHRNVPRVIYNLETNKNGRFLGVFKMKMRMNAEVDPETGEILEVRKPWWAFMVGGEDNYDDTANADDDSDLACTEELRTCADGSTVERNPELGCEFNLCPGETVSSETTCEENGGIWGLQHAADEAPSCNEPTNDAGTTCTDSNECESYCEAPEGSDADETVTGTCYGYQTASCMQEVTNGKAQVTWCE